MNNGKTDGQFITNIQKHEKILLGGFLWGFPQLYPNPPNMSVAFTEVKVPHEMELYENSTITLWRSPSNLRWENSKCCKTAKAF